MKTRTYEAMAKLIASKLTDKELNELTFVMDGDPYSDDVYVSKQEI